MIAVAILVGIWIAGREARRKGIHKTKIQDFFLYVVFGAIIGARLYYVAFAQRAQLWENPLSLFAIWQGGLAIHGGILGGLAVALLYSRRLNVPFWKLADTVSPSLILGQAIGRIGCFLNGDAHGYPTSLPWGIVYSPESPAGQMYQGQPLHPTQLYEMILNFGIFLVLWKIRKRLRTDGHLFLVYVILYSAIRIFVEYFRADKLFYVGNISAAQSIGILGIIISIAIMFTLKKNTPAKAPS